MPDLSQLVDRARAARVADEDARAYVSELGRWARVEPAPRRAWPWWLGGGLALAAAAAVVLLVVQRRAEDTVRAPIAAAIQVGARVAMVADPGTRWRIARASDEQTEIVVEQGTVTARLFPGERAHRLALRGAHLVASATGTVYSLTVGDQGGSVEVHEGTVEVVRDDAPEEVPHVVRTGARWPESAASRTRVAVDLLLALAPPPAPPPPPTPAIETPDAAPILDASAVVVDAQPASPPPRDAAEPPARSITDRWRQARLLRGQGDFEGAIRECLAIADARDPTWSPIALVEAARIELGPRASPERTISLVERFLAEWASHQLAPEARELRCRALRQLGREAECTEAP